MPKRSRSGLVSSPARVVAPTSVNLARSSLHRARRRPLADDQIELKILHRRIKHFLDRRIEPVNLVDEQDVALFQIGEQRREIAGFGDDRPRGARGNSPRARARRSAPAWSCRGPAALRTARGRALRLRARAASMKTARFVRACSWPTNSESFCGRSEASAASSSRRSAPTSLRPGVAVTSPALAGICSARDR